MIPYFDQDAELEGYLVSTAGEKRPTVILCHAWNGRDPYICEMADMVAAWGYTAFALDIYGKGVIGRSPEENAALKKPFLSDRSILKRRLTAAYEAVSGHPSVDASRMGVIGFGFGGLSALDMARYYPSLKGAVSVYGHFEEPHEKTNEHISAKILILHGYKDPVVTIRDLDAFQKELSRAGVDWQSHVYSQAMHAFTTPSANKPEFGIAYHAPSTRRAWKEIRHFINEALAQPD